MDGEPQQAGSRVIVVGVDGSAGSKGALAWAARQARLEQASLEPIISFEPLSIPWTPYPVDIIGEVAIELFEGFRNRR